MDAAHTTRPARLSPIVTDRHICGTTHKLLSRSARLPWRNGATLRIVAGITVQPVPVIGARKTWACQSGHRAELWAATPIGRNRRIILWFWRHRPTDRHAIVWARS